MKFILEESPQRIDKQSHHCMKYAISMTCKSIYGIIHASVLITIMHEISANFYKWQLTVERSVQKVSGVVAYLVHMLHSSPLPYSPQLMD